MTLHLIKLCVGAGSLEDLEAWIGRRARPGPGRGARHVTHTTRMAPKRAAELLDGGSLYWVIKGAVQGRQRILDIRETTGEDGHKACNLLLDATVVRTRTRPHRPFQGWRYLPADEAPDDVDRAAAGGAVPREMAAELMELCLL